LAVNLCHGNVADEQRWHHRGNQRVPHWRSSFANRVAAASAYVDQSCDDFAWCEAIGHRSIPRYCASVSTLTHEASEKSAAGKCSSLVQRRVFMFGAASNFCCFGSNIESPACFPVLNLVVGRWLARASCSIKYEFMFLAPMPSRLTANPIAWPKLEFNFVNLSLIEALMSVGYLRWD
jgi:hypothetical protein